KKPNKKKKYQVTHQSQNDSSCVFDPLFHSPLFTRHCFHDQFIRVCQLAAFTACEERGDRFWRRITSTSSSKPSRVATPHASCDSAAWLHSSRQRWQRNTRDAQVCAQGSRVSR